MCSGFHSQHHLLKTEKELEVVKYRLQNGKLKKYTDEERFQMEEYHWLQH